MLSKVLPCQSRSGFALKLLMRRGFSSVLLSYCRDTVTEFFSFVLISRATLPSVGTALVCASKRKGLLIRFWHYFLERRVVYEEYYMWLFYL